MTPSTLRTAGATRVGRTGSYGGGAAAGAAAAVAFTALHGVLISDIWFNVVPMTIAGALCGLCLVWSHLAAVPSPTVNSWLRYIAASVGVLLSLGLVSLLVLDPITSMAELMASADPLREVLPPALPLMVGASLIGSIVIWVALSRRPAALVPIVVTQTLLVFLVGHNLAIIGLVDVPPESRYLVAEFAALTVVLAALCAGLYLLADAAPWPRRR